MSISADLCITHFYSFKFSLITKVNRKEALEIIKSDVSQINHKQIRILYEITQYQPNINEAKLERVIKFSIDLNEILLKKARYCYIFNVIYLLEYFIY